MSAPVLGAGERARRRADVARTPGVHALDGVEARPGPGGTLLLRLRFAPPPPGGAPLPVGVAPAAVRVTGPAGPVPVVSVSPAPGGDALLATAVPAAGADAGGEYTVDLGAVPSVDPLLASGTVWVSSPAEGDETEGYGGRRPAAAPHPTVPAAECVPVLPGAPPPPSIDYLSKDYATFRAQMLDRMAVTLPGWSERHAADLGVMLVEVLAYAADYLSYNQDSVATEAYLGTARLRTSLARHARLLDYRVNQGCSALAWVQVRVAAAVRIPGRTRVRTRTAQPVAVLVPGTGPYAGAMTERPETFETLHELQAEPGLNEIPIYTWGLASYTLPAGTRECTLQDAWVVGGRALDALAQGTVLVLQEQLAPGGGPPDPAHRQAVRLEWVERGVDAPAGARTGDARGVPLVKVRWYDADALAFSLVVAGSAAGATYSGGAVALGNLVLATQGQTHGPWTLPPVPAAGAYRPYRPYVPHLHVSRRPHLLRRGVESLPAAALQAGDPGHAVGEVWLTDERGRSWTARADLLRSTPFSRDFVVEADEEGASRLRFGDGNLGMRPPPGTRFTVECRVGVGAQGNVGREVLAHLELKAGDPDAARITGAVLQVRNPVPGWGGSQPELPRVVRARAPQRWQQQDRGVTPADWEALAQALPPVRRARAVAGWQGTSPQDQLWVQRKGPLHEDEAFLAGVRAALEPRRLAGRGLRVLPPVYVGVVVALQVGLYSGTVRSAAEQALRTALGPGPGGVFSPDGLTFGQPVWLSAVVAAANGVAGVEWVKALRFDRWDPYGGAATVHDELRMGPHEVARMADQPAQPWNGSLTLELVGGIG